MKKKVIFGVIFIILIMLLWLVVWGDFDEWRYSKNLHCMTFQNSRKVEICKSIEKYQEYKLFGHAMFSAGYRSSFAGVKKSWCELHLTQEDLNLLQDMQYEHSHPPQLSSGSSMLFRLLDASLNKKPDLYNGDMYEPSSSNYLIKDGCSK